MMSSAFYVTEYINEKVLSFITTSVVFVFESLSKSVCEILIHFSIKVIITFFFKMNENRKPKVVIVGAGLVGSNVAYYLSKTNRFDVTVLEAESEPAMITSNTLRHNVLT